MGYNLRLHNYYTKYIEILFKTYRSNNHEISEPSSFGEIIGNRVGRYKFDQFDLFIMVNYLKPSKLKNLIESYDVVNIEVDVLSIIIYGMLKNIIISYRTLENNRMLKNPVINTINLLGVIKNESIEEFKKHLEEIIRLTKNNFMDLEIYCSINYFLVKKSYINKNLLDYNSLKNLLISYVNKILDSKYNNQNGGWEIKSLNNTSLIQTLADLLDNDEYSLDNEDDVFIKLMNKLKCGELKEYKEILKILTKDLGYNQLDMSI